MAQRNPGTLVISLDLEASWGMRDYLREGADYVRNLRGERRAISMMLSLFAEHNISATWGTVGLLFAGGRAEAERYSPALRPNYRDSRLDPYREAMGESEEQDPLHFAPSVIQEIAACPGQEIGSHTFSHFYCGEPGQCIDEFRADLMSAQRIARDKGYDLKSLIFPRNQVNPAYASVVREAGFISYRGNPPFGGYQNSRSRLLRTFQRGYRLVDTFANLSGQHLLTWESLREASGLANVRASAFLRPYAPSRKHYEVLKFRRIVRALSSAARTGKIFHLWWHPHNFGRFHEENIGFLRRVLEAVSDLKTKEGMLSLSMRQVAERAA
jgi:peptidoglycan/xylan/chitin deacetylase (PgdA/CDA1 family)